VSALGLAASYAWDLPTGATVVTAFGLLLATLALALALRRLVARVRADGVRALRGVALAATTLVAGAGALLALVPAMDHHWLDWLESRAPTIELLFLTPGERRAFWDSQDALVRGTAELERLKAISQEVQWGTRPMDEARQERLRQFVAGRGEIAAGDRMVLRTLRLKARARQRFWLGLPLVLAGGAATLLLARSRLTGPPAQKEGAMERTDA
jgi:zinc/manganese transport system permease protein